MFKTNIRKVLETGFSQTLKLFPNIKNVIKGKLSIFLYHEVTDNPSEFCRFYDNLAVSTSLFQKQISWISDNFNIIHPDELINNENKIENSAIITFDDGFLGAFQNGISYLVEQSIPSTMFMNMRSILEERPITSSIICYLDRYSLEFRQFAEAQGLERPYSHTLTPALLDEFEDTYGPCNLAAATEFQGPLATLSEIKKWQNNDLVTYGNHLFDHWNSRILSDNEFIEQYQKNQHSLKNFNVNNNYFAFTNGQPGSCFTQREIDLLRQLGAKKIFFSAGQTNQNPKNYLLDRIALSNFDESNKHLWFRILRLYLLHNNKASVNSL